MERYTLVSTSPPQNRSMGEHTASGGWRARRNMLTALVVITVNGTAATALLAAATNSAVGAALGPRPRLGRPEGHGKPRLTATARKAPRTTLLTSAAAADAGQTDHRLRRKNQRYRLRRPNGREGESLDRIIRESTSRCADTSEKGSFRGHAP